MRRWLMSFLVIGFALLSLAACSDDPVHVAQFWRPISEPNLLMSLDKAQRKLDFDLSQCHCGIYPANTPHSDAIDFQPDHQSLAETSVTAMPNSNGNCTEKPSLIVSECMRYRGWEATNCSGRTPLPGGGSLCSAYAY